jgi:hypothetical protein
MADTNIACFADTLIDVVLENFDPFIFILIILADIVRAIIATIIY